MEVDRCSESREEKKANKPDKKGRAPRGHDFQPFSHKTSLGIEKGEENVNPSLRSSTNKNKGHQRFHDYNLPLSCCQWRCGRVPEMWVFGLHPGIKDGPCPRLAHAQSSHGSQPLLGIARHCLRRLTLPVSCGPQKTMPGVTEKACAVGRQLHWVVMRA